MSLQSEYRQEEKKLKAEQDSQVSAPLAERRGLQADCTPVTADQAFSVFMSLLKHRRLYMLLSYLGQLS